MYGTASAAASLLYAPLPKTDKPKRIAVVGGGASGMSFAVFAGECGHYIDIFESGRQLGGRLLTDSDSYECLSRLKVRLGRLKNVSVLLNTYADETSLRGKYDAIVYANGAAEKPLPFIEGLGDIAFCTASEFLLCPLCIPKSGSGRIAVIGSGRTAHLAADSLTDRLGKQRVIRIGENSEPLRFSNGTLYVRRFTDTGSLITAIDCCFAVIDTGKAPDSSQFLHAQRAELAPELYCIGSARSVGDIGDDIRSAYALASCI